MVVLEVLQTLLYGVPALDAGDGCNNPVLASRVESGSVNDRANLLGVILDQDVVGIQQIVGSAARAAWPLGHVRRIHPRDEYDRGEPPLSTSHEIQVTGCKRSQVVVQIHRPL